MTDSLEVQLAAARADHHEQEVVARRLIDTRADRQRLVELIAATEVVLANEQADVAKLETGVGGAFRRMAASREDLTREQQDVAAAELQLEALRDELRAVEFDLTQLCQREVKVAGADARFKALAARVPEAAGGTQGSALVESIASVRREIAEAIAVGGITRKALDTVHNASIRAKNVSMALDLTEVVQIHEELGKSITNSQRALRNFQRECREVKPDAPLDGLAVTAMPTVSSLLGLDLALSEANTVEEAVTLSGIVEACLAELAVRDAELQRALAT